ncbi:MAG TPA: PQQ-binding-like beta-propeller repeat protein [Steroidobacteraceae bacterium]|nr:PQQ-binding-like beta-propeller repeat protein [Steroidobacteraceae bacterium]
MQLRIPGLAALALTALAGTAQAAQSEADALFTTQCALCHAENVAPAGSPNEKAPTRAQLRQFSAEAVLTSLTSGKMQLQGSVLTETQRRAVSEFATGKLIAASTGSAPATNRCTRSAPMGNPAQGASWNGFGNGAAATRFQDAKAGGLTAADLPRLKLKWAFGYTGVAAARAQPTLAGGRLFVGSESGEVHALDPATGCSHWSFKAAAGVRTAPSVTPFSASGRSGNAVIFGDTRATLYALDADTGATLWTLKIDDHASAGITGSPIVHDGRVFVGVQGLSEEGRGASGGYGCCTFRGSLSAVEVNTGKLLWKTYTIEESKPRAKNAAGVQMFGPAGGAIWSAPSVDVKRGLVYVATGNGYADPPQPMTDAIIAFDQKTGAVRWHYQVLAADQWAMGCQPTNPNNPGCPAVMGPDFDFSATPMLATTGGRDIIVVPQKSGIAFALDPDRNGALLWKTTFGLASGLGGQWGGAADGMNFYTGTNGFQAPVQGGITAINLATGKITWQSPPPDPLLCGQKARGCGGGQGAAVTVIPGAVLSGSHDGGLRAYATGNGEVIWTFNANQEFPTVNGVKANGASMDGPGPIVAGGMLYVNAGYGGLVGRPGNVLLAFALE